MTARTAVIRQAGSRHVPLQMARSPATNASTPNHASDGHRISVSGEVTLSVVGA